MPDLKPMPGPAPYQRTEIDGRSVIVWTDHHGQLWTLPETDVLKPLTPAECAAEMWKMQSALHGVNAPHAELAQRTHLWHRFATTPSIWEK